MSQSTGALTEPLIGIALAAYQPDIDYFAAQLLSISEQSYGNWFCVVGFDSPLSGVKDEPQLTPYFADSRFEFVQNSGQPGATENFNRTALRCLEKSPRYIAFSDQDDVWYPEKLTRLEQAIAHKPVLSIVHCDMHVLLKRGGSFQKLEGTVWQREHRGVESTSSLDFMIRNIAAGAGMILDAQLIARYPQVPADAFGHDHWYPLVATYFGGVHPLYEPLYAYRIHGANIAGLSEYRSFFASSKNSRELGVVRKCMSNFNTSKARCLYAVEAGLAVSWTHRLTTFSSIDCGFGYLVKAAMCFRKDRPTARASLARAAGKIFRFFYRSFVSYSPM